MDQRHGSATKIAIESSSPSYLKNVSLKFVSGVVGFVLSTLSGIILARVLGVEGNGTATLLLLIPQLVVRFSNLGIGKANGYLVGAKRYTLQTLVGNSLFMVAIMSLLIGLVGWMAMPIYLPFLSESNIDRSMLTLAALVIPAALLEVYLEGLLLGLERIPQLSLVTVTRFLALLILNLVLVWALDLGIAGVLLTAIATPGICVLLYVFFLRRDATMRPALDSGALKSALTFGIQGHLGNVLHFMNLRLDVFILSFFAGARSVGLYAVATALAELLPFFSMAFSYVLFPKTAASDPEAATRFTPWVARLSALITISAAVAMLVLSRPLIAALYSSEYLPALYPLWILLPGVVSLGYAGVIHSDLSGRGKPYYSTYGALVSLLVTVGLDLWLIPRWDIIGAAVASSTAYVANAAVAVYFFQRTTGIGLADLLLVRRSDIQTGLNAGRAMVLSLNRAFRLR